MGFPKQIKEVEHEDNHKSRPDWRYKKYLQQINGTEFLTFEEDCKEGVNRRIQAILNDKRLIKKNKDTLTDYHLYLANVMQSINSRASYLTYVLLLAVEVKKDFDKITKKDLQTFFLGLEKRKLKERSIFNSKLYLRCFFRWLYNLPQDVKREEMPDVISWIQLKKDMLIRTPDEVLTIEDVKKMAQISDNPRDSAIHLTLFETGARSGEFLRLKISDVKFDKYGAVINVPNGKTGHYKTYRKLRMIYCVPALKKWIEMSPVKEDPNAELWINLGSHLGKALGKDGLKRIVKVTGKRAGIPLKKCYPHSYRHCRCYDLISKSFTDKDLRMWFAWSNTSNMPSVYSSSYGMKDTEYKILKQEGLLDEEEINGKEELLKPKICAKCGHQNSSTLKFCEKCYFALDLKTFVDEEKQKEESEDIIVKVLNRLKQNKEARKLIFQAIEEENLKDKLLSIS